MKVTVNMFAYEKLRKLTTIFKVTVPLLVLTAFFSVYLIGIENQKPLVYIISMQNDLQPNWINAVKLVNTLLYLNVKVYWLCEPIHTSIDGVEHTFGCGDFIISFGQAQALFAQYTEKLSTDLNVSILKIYDNVKVHVYPLKQAKVAVFYGGGVTGSSLELIYPLEEAGFNLEIVREEDLRQGKISEYNAIIFPGGSFYGNYLDEKNKESIRDFVRSGGGFFGICGGAVLGIELGLLDAELAMAGRYGAYANLRGPVLLKVTRLSSPIVFGCSAFFESIYFMGPFISKVGNGVEIICSYHSPTENLSLFFPEIAKAYNFTPQTETINDFWGFPSIIFGRYGAGGVILSAVHPEVLPSSRRLLINSIFYLSSDEQCLLETLHHSYATEASKPDFRYENLGILNKSLFSQVNDLLSLLGETSSKARQALTGLEGKNYQIVGVSGEYLLLFLEDVSSRSRNLIFQLNELINFYNSFENLQFTLNNRQPPNLIHSLVRKYLLLSIEKLQVKITKIYQSMLKLRELINIMDAVNEELLNEKLLLQQILIGNMSSKDSYQNIINLHALETSTLCKIKDNLEGYMLNWAFEIRCVLVEAHFMNYATKIYLKSALM